MGFNNTKMLCIPQIGFLIIPILYGMRFLLDHTLFAVSWTLYLCNGDSDLFFLL